MNQNIFREGVIALWISRDIWKKTTITSCLAEYKNHINREDHLKYDVITNDYTSLLAEVLLGIMDQEWVGTFMHGNFFFVTNPFSFNFNYCLIKAKDVKLDTYHG